MKKDINFWLSLEEYLGKLSGRSPLPWQWLGVGMVLSVVLASLLNVKNSMIGARDVREGIQIAVSIGDYEMARKLFEGMLYSRSQAPVLGAESELQDKIYPEQVVGRRISELEEKLKIYPGNREIYQELAKLYSQLDNQEKASEYIEKARILDPNGVEF